jgi:putative hemolysin
MGTVFASIALLFGNAFFVAAEYGLVSSRRSRIDALARKGNRAAKSVLFALDHMADFVAGIQIGITMFGIALGAITEPALSDQIGKAVAVLPPAAVSAISITLVAYPMVVLSELAPKYLTLRHPERVALAVIHPLRFAVAALKPLVWLFQISGALLLRPFGIDTREGSEDGISKEELELLLRSGQVEGQFAEHQADVVSRALRLDKLDAGDVMVHRMDVKWLDKSTPASEVLPCLAVLPHSRVPVCDGDVDEVVGIVYVQDVLKNLGREDVTLEVIARPAEFVPETLTLDRVVQRMREAKTQILIVRDEYGGTSGLLTLEDVVEEIFGELEDSLEGERPPIERVGSQRVTARADVRYDELMDFLDHEVEPESPWTTETLAEIVVSELGRVPRIGDSVQTPVGLMRVENMARRRVTRISVQAH